MAALTAYVRKTGSDNNGGSSNTVSAEKTGTDGVTDGTTTFTSGLGTFAAGDVDKLINIVTKGRYRIATFVNSTTITLSGSPSIGASLTWNIGGAVATIGAILANANNAFQSADICYIGAGTYREVITVAMTSAVAETLIQGDVDGSKTGDAGDVIWTAYLTDDITAPSSSSLITLNARDFLTFKNILFVGGGNTISVVSASVTNSVNIAFGDCTALLNGGTFITYAGLADVASNWIVDRCYIFNTGNNGPNSIAITLPTSSIADYDSNFLIQNCAFIGPAIAVNVTSSGALASRGGGIDILNCSILSVSSTGIRAQSNISTTIPCTVYNSVILAAGGTGLNAASSGQIVENNNRIIAATPRTNVAVGISSISDNSHAPLIEFGYDLIVGRLLRPFGMPMVSSPLLGRATAAIQPSIDILKRPRPAGGESSLYGWGAYELHDTADRETSTLYGGSSAIVLTGPADHDFAVPVDATLTTFTVYARYDSNHNTFNKPQMKVLNGEEIGVSEATVTMALGANQWELLTLSFTPTAKGIVTVRFISRSLTGNGKAFFDEFSY